MADVRPLSDAHRVRGLVRLAVLAVRRTAVEDSVRALAAAATLVVLADGSRRITTPRALDAWVFVALAWAVAVPAALSGGSPLRSLRVRLLPVSPAVLRRARIVAGAPMRLVFALAVPIGGAVAAPQGVVVGGDVLVLSGWAVVACVMGAALDEQWHGRRAGLARALATSVASYGAWCVWWIGAQTERVASPAIPSLLPRGSAAAEWLWVVAAAASCVAVSVVTPRATSLIVMPSISGSRASALFASARCRTQLSTNVIFRVARRPRFAQEFALLARHIGPRLSLALVALLACAATFGRVPALAFVACTPMIVLTANALGADVPLGGSVRYNLSPESLSQVRDRRLTAWALATALAALLGTSVGLALPAPAAAGHPAGGVMAAPALLLYGACLIPWFGRASWWWARRYPQPFAQRLRDMASPSALRLPGGPAYLALGLLGGWALVAFIASVLWAASFEGIHALVAVTPPSLSFVASGTWEWSGSAVVAAATSIGVHRGLCRRALRTDGERRLWRVESPT